MFQAFFTGLSGLFSFSKNLDTVSNNIANMNTPGFRGQDTFYKSLGGNDGSGVGAQVSGLGFRFGAGDQTQTGNALDLAISGNGFFVLLDGDELRYTRAGNFELKNDVLVDKVTGLEVAQYTAAGEVTKFDLSSLQTDAHETTTQVDFSGTLSTSDEDNTHSVNDITVYNDLGEAVTVNFKFNKTTDVNNNVLWEVEITDKDGNSLIQNPPASLSLNATGPNATFETIDFQVTNSQGTSTNITANFNGENGVNAANQKEIGVTSNMTAAVKDGKPEGTLQTNTIAFNTDGTMTLKYDNGTEKTGPAIALAEFDDTDALELVGGAIFKASDNSGRTIGQAGSGQLGDINAAHLELSNVDLSREFAEMIIVQRGYQASSRVLNIANQMLEQLYDSTRGR